MGKLIHPLVLQTLILQITLRPIKRMAPTIQTWKCAKKVTNAALENAHHQVRGWRVTSSAQGLELAPFPRMRRSISIDSLTLSIPSLSAFFQFQLSGFIPHECTIVLFSQLALIQNDKQMVLVAKIVHGRFCTWAAGFLHLFLIVSRVELNLL